MLGTMNGSLTHETMTGAEEQIYICIRKPMEGIESVTVHGHVS
jgi:hypothetical protein